MPKDQGKSKDFISDEMWHTRVWHHGGSRWRNQAPVKMSCGPLFRMWYAFSKPILGVPNVGRNTELQLGVAEECVSHAYGFSWKRSLRPTGRAVSNYYRLLLSGHSYSQNPCRRGQEPSRCVFILSKRSPMG